MEGFVGFELPYPAKILWPNGRGHWAVKAREFKKHKAWACYAVQATKGAVGMVSGPVEWAVTFHPKTRHPVDADNCVSSLKAYQDGIAQALGIDDRHFMAPKVSFGEPVKGGRVVAWVKAL